MREITIKPKTSITKDVKILLKKNQVIEKMLEHTQSVHIFQSKDVEDYTKLLKNYQTEERKEK